MDEAELAAWCDAVAALLNLPIQAGNRAEVIANLRVIARQMRLVADFSLVDRAEPASIFRA